MGSSTPVMMTGASRRGRRLSGRVESGRSGCWARTAPETTVTKHTMRTTLRAMHASQGMLGLDGPVTGTDGSPAKHQGFLKPTTIIPWAGGEAMEEARRSGPGWVALCIGGNVLFGAGLFFHAFLYNFYLDALGHSEAVMGYAAAALTGGGLAVLLPAGRLVDRVGPRAAMVAAALVAGLGLGLGAWVVAPFPVYAAAAVAGVGGGLWRVAVGPALMQLTEGGTRARAFAWNVGLILLLGAGGIVVAGAVPDWFRAAIGVSRLGGLRLALLAGALATATSLAAFGFLRLSPAAAGPSPVPAPEGRGADAAGRVAVRILPAAGVVAVFMLGAALLAPFLNIYFTRRFSLSVGSVGWLFGGTQVLWGLAVLASGELASRWGARRVLPVAALAFAP